MAERFRRFLLRYKGPAAFAAVIVPLWLGVAASGALLRNRTLSASIPVREERASGVLTAVEAARTEARAALSSLLPPVSGHTPSAVRALLARSGWRVVDDTTRGAITSAASGQAFLEGAMREGVVTEFILDAGEPLLMAGVRVVPEGVIIAWRPATALLARALGSDPSVGAALYTEGGQVVADPSPLGSLLPSELDEELLSRVIGEDRPTPLEMGSGGALLGAVVPLKDFEAWDVIGVLAAAAPRSRIAGVDGSVGAALLVLLLLLGLAAAGFAAWGAVVGPGRSRAVAACGLIPLVAGALLYRSRLKEMVEATLSAGPEQLRQALAAGGLVEQFSFGAELLLLGGLVVTVLWSCLVLLTAWNLGPE
ncbi:MAG: hypothetical protein KAT18_05170 [Candidatus Latescibacteria bacterium]|nr:hypothetical protein [Candidatus Latescibacterota bacterium]